MFVLAQVLGFAAVIACALAPRAGLICLRAFLVIYLLGLTP
jgi:hypothetical protein